jgi:small-conductance mechanosensitive channel
MTPEELQKHSKMIDDSVSWLQQRTDDVWFRYEKIDDCHTQECEKEKSFLKQELFGYLDKLQDEEEMIDKYEEILHNRTGIK